MFRASFSHPSRQWFVYTFGPRARRIVVCRPFSDQPPAFTKAEVEEWLNLNGFDRDGCNGPTPASCSRIFG